MPTRFLQRPALLGLLSLFGLTLLTAWTYLAPAVESASTDPAFEMVMQGPTESVFRLSISTNEILYNPADQLLYATRPSVAGTVGNGVTRINPLNGSIVGSTYVGSEPNKMALSDDGQTMYISLDGAYSIRRYDTTTQTPGNKFSIGRGQSVNALDAPYLASDMAVVPGNPNKLAVARFLPGISPPGTGVALYDNGVRLPNTGPGHSAGANFIAFSSSPETLWGGGYDTGLRRMVVDANGITDISPETSPSWVRRVKFQGDLLFDSDGHIYNPVSRTLLGTCPGVLSSAFVPDVATGRVLFAYKEGSTQNVTIKACDINTFTIIGTLTVPNVGSDLFVTSLVRYGSNGLAFRTTNNQIYFVQTALIPTDNPLPVPTSTPANTPTPTPTVYSRFIRTVPLPNRDFIYRPTDQKFYVSVPNSVGAPRANTVTRIDSSGAIEDSVPVGTDPGRLAFSDDYQTMYVGINGSNAVRKVDMATQTPGFQFPLGTGINGPLNAYEIQVLPGTSDSVAISYGNAHYSYDGTHIYDNGVRRAQKADAAGRIHIAGNSLYIGDYYNSKWQIGPTGLTLQQRFSTSGSSSESVLIGSLLYMSGGGVIDLNSPNYDFIGSFTGAGYRPGIAIDAPNNRLYMLADLSFGTPSWNILAYRLDNFQPIGSIPLPGVTLQFSYPDSPHRLYRFGTNGLAFHNNDDKIYFVQSDLIGSGPVPTGLQLGSTNYFGSEGSTQTVAVTVTRSGELSGTSTVDYATADGTATAGLDYVASSGTLTFAPGETTKTVNIGVINDNVFEGNESFTLALSNPGGTGSVEVVTPSTTTINIQDNDSTPSMTPPSNSSVSEPRITGTTTVTLNLQLSNPTTQTATVNYATANGTATAGIDYIAASGQVTFAPLETTKTIQVEILADQIYNEPTETFSVNFTNPVNCFPFPSTVSVSIANFNPANVRHAKFDFDDDGKTDVGIFRPSVGEWWISMSSNGNVPAYQFGAGTDRIAPADFTGDGKTDIAFFRPETGEWFVIRSEDLSFFSFPFGAAEDIPLPADYDGDGKADVAVFRPSDGNWYIRRSTDGVTTAQLFGVNGDQPVPADYDGDRKTDVAIYRPSVGEWWIYRSTAGVIAYGFGNSTDKVVPGDYTGDGKADVAFWRPVTGDWYILRSQDTSYYSAPFGASTDVPTPGDYDGDGRFDVTVFRPSNGTWYVNKSSGGTSAQQFGTQGDKPLPTAFLY